MDRTTGRGFGLLLATLLVGCGDTQTDAPVLTDPTTGSRTNTQTNTISKRDEPIARNAHAFLDSVIQGDTRRATALLTPRAVEQIRHNGKAFAPPGLETAGFELGRIRKPSPEQALVQCFLSDSASGGNQKEEMCCMMKLVDGHWLVSGIAFRVSPQKPPFILDFEKPAQSGSSQQSLVGEAMTPPAGPIRTAQDPAYSTGR